MSDEGNTERLEAALDGKYRIERKLGEGGMASVYLAEDIKHERKVALKVLKPELAAVVGAERFLAEIKTTANLQHPHILPLHDSGDAAGFLFYVMPYVEGESLRERLHREHQLPVDEALQIAKNVAEALDYAHGQGVIHRDIKPANILLQAGKPVISDFGIALAVGVAGGGRLTETGLSLGTPHYMSPEQATGDLSVGPATDIYALGCVLYEMLVGEPPYTGSTPQAILGKIITSETRSASAERISVPLNMDGVVRRALEKVPADRFRSAGELAQALGDPGFRHGDQHVWAERAPGAALRRTGAIALGAAAVGVLIGIMVSPRSSEVVTAPAPSMRFEVPTPDGLVMPFAQDAPFRISPDGSLLAYFAPDGIAIRPIDSFEARVLPDTRDAFTLMFSPQSDRIAFIQGTDLKWVSVEGGPVITVAEIGALGSVGSSWSADGGFLLTGVGTNGVLWVPEDGGSPTRITEVLVEEDENIHAWPTDVPGAEAILFTTLGPGGGWADGRTVLFDRTTREREVLIEGGTNAQYVPTGHILYVDAAGTVFARPFELSAREWGGPAVPIVSGVRTSVWGGGASYHASGTGVLAWTTGSEFESHRFVAVDRSGSVIEELGLSSGVEFLELSHAGDRFLISRPTGDNIDQWIFDIDSHEEDRFTFDINEEESAIWSPGDERIMWAAAQPGGGRLAFVGPVDGSAAREQVFEHPYHLHLTDWTQDGRYVTFYDFHPSEGRNVYLVDLEDSARIIPIATTTANEDLGTFSPDGRWLAYTSDETGRVEVFRVSVPGGGQKRQVSTNGGYQPRWHQQQRELYYQDRGGLSSESPTLMARAIQDGSTLAFGPEIPLFSQPAAVAYEPSLDGDRFYTYIARPESRAYSIRVLLNWPAELQATPRSTP